MGGESRSFSGGSRSAGAGSRILDGGSRNRTGGSRSFDGGSRTRSGSTRSFDRDSRTWSSGSRNWTGGSRNWSGGSNDYYRYDRRRHSSNRSSLSFFFGLGYPFGYYNYYPYYYPYYNYGYYGYRYPYYNYGYYDYGYPRDTYGYDDYSPSASVEIADNVIVQWLGPDDLRVTWTGDTKDVVKVEVAMLDSSGRTLRHRFSMSPVLAVDMGVPNGASSVRIRTIDGYGRTISEVVSPLPARY